MALNTRVVLAAGTDTAQSDPIKVYAVNPVTLVGFGFSGGTDVLTVEVNAGDTDSAADWEPAGKDGAAIEITATNNPVTVYGPGVFRVVRTATTSESIGCSTTTNQG